MKRLEQMLQLLFQQRDAARLHDHQCVAIQLGDGNTGRVRVFRRIMQRAFRVGQAEMLDALAEELFINVAVLPRLRERMGDV